MVQPVVTRVTAEDARQRAGVALRSSAAEGALSIEDSITIELTGPSLLVALADGLLAADSDDLRILPPGFSALEDSLRDTKGHETIAVSVRFKKAGDSVKVVVIGYIVSKGSSSAHKRMSLQEATATATARFDGDGFWAVDLIFPTAGAQLYQVRLEVPADLVKVFAWTF